MANDLYSTGLGGDLYSTGTRKELDLRKEMQNTLLGASDEIAKGRAGLLRRMRREDNGDLVRCPCRDVLTDEPELDYICYQCYGHGWLWDEQEIVYYKNDDAYRKWGYTIFYVRYSVDLFDKNYIDKDFIVEIQRDASGSPVSPIVRTRLYKISEVSDFRADDGRIEYWRINASWDKKWSVWSGRYLDDGVQIRTPGAAD